MIRIGGRTAEEIIAERLEEFAQAPPADLPPSNKGRSRRHSPASGSSTSGFCIEDCADRYVLHNVPSGTSLLDIGYSKELLEGGKLHTQDDWIHRTVNEEFHLPSGLDYGASICALYDNRDVGNPQQHDLVNRVKKMFRNDFRSEGPYMMTSTRVAWTPAGTDEVYHRYGYPDVSRIDRNLVGADGEIGPGLKDYADAMFGTHDVAKVKEAVTWLTGKKPYVWRFNKRPQQREECVLRVGLDGFLIATNDDIFGNRPARGVVVRAVASSGAGGA